MPLSQQDILTIVNLLMIAIVVVLFPPGGGTPRRIPVPWKAPRMSDSMYQRSETPLSSFRSC